jgi:hypothetical protein
MRSLRTLVLDSLWDRRHGDPCLGEIQPRITPNLVVNRAYPPFVAEDTSCSVSSVDGRPVLPSASPP